MSEQAREHVGPSLHFPATVRLHCCKARVSPCRRVATAAKIRKPTDVLSGYAQRPGTLPQNPAVLLQTSACLFQRDARAGSTPQQRPEQCGAQPQSPCSSLSPLPSPLSFETQNTGYVHLVLGLARTSAFSLQTQRQSTASVCAPP